MSSRSSWKPPSVRAFVCWVAPDQRLTSLRSEIRSKACGSECKGRGRRPEWLLAMKKVKIADLLPSHGEPGIFLAPDPGDGVVNAQDGHLKGNPRPANALCSGPVLEERVDVHDPRPATRRLLKRVGLSRTGRSRMVREISFPTSNSTGSMVSEIRSPLTIVVTTPYMFRPFHPGGLSISG